MQEPLLPHTITSQMLREQLIQYKSCYVSKYKSRHFQHKLDLTSKVQESKTFRRSLPTRHVTYLWSTINKRPFRQKSSIPPQYSQDSVDGTHSQNESSTDTYTTANWYLKQEVHATSKTNRHTKSERNIQKLLLLHLNRTSIIANQLRGFNHWSNATEANEELAAIGIEIAS